jgi:hypothetical protein
MARHLVCKGNATVSQVETYLENQGTECPICGNDDIYGYGSTMTAGASLSDVCYLVDRIRCNVCTSEWKEYHMLVGIEITSIAGK